MRKQKTDRRDAAQILKLLIEGRFPRLWTPSAEQRSLRQLLIHRHKLVGIWVQVKNGLQHLMLNRGVQLKVLGVDQPKVSALMRGRLTDFSTERLFRFLGRLDQDVRITIAPKPPSSRKPPTLAVHAEEGFTMIADSRR